MYLQLRLVVMFWNYFDSIAFNCILLFVVVLVVCSFYEFRAETWYYLYYYYYYYHHYLEQSPSWKANRSSASP
jgi:hypothetical protein